MATTVILTSVFLENFPSSLATVHIPHVITGKATLAPLNDRSTNHKYLSAYIGLIIINLSDIIM